MRRKLKAKKIPQSDENSYDPGGQIKNIKYAKYVIQSENENM